MAAGLSKEALHQAVFRLTGPSSSVGTRFSMEIPNIGWMTILADPTGATIALFQPTHGTGM